MNGAVPARTLILAGTPSGTVFAGIPKTTMAAGLLRWAAGGWGQAPTRHVIESYIEAAQKERRFLQPGDQVLIRVQQLGAIETVIEP
ncbi:MAG: fumarylacetoacetate hydrolase family protein [Candidatus Hydrogenedentes bacterium]|nr:fumarylacetoacetate hydrolase family protein [Candidatus Hydrogenedentota bacterium]